MQLQGSRVRRLFVLLAVLFLVAASCRRGPELIFGSGPRFPDDEGLVTDVNFQRVELDDERRYEIRQDVQSFSTYDGSVTPLLHYKDRYVHLGLDDDKRVQWVAGIGLVIGGDPPTVVYNGVVSKADKKKHRLIFKDGTVLTVAKQVELPEPGLKISAKIQPFKRVIVEIVLQ